MIKKIIKFLRENWYIALIFVVALILRLVYLRDTITVGVDSVDHLNFAKQIYSNYGYLWHGPQLRSIICNGQDIVAYLGPFYVYLLVIPAAISHWNFLLPTAWQGIVGALSIIAYYYLTKELTNNKVASRIVAIFLTFSFALVIADRTMWNPNFLALFVALTILSFIRMIKGRDGYLISFVLFFALCAQIHASSWLFIPAFIILWAIYRIRIKRVIFWLYATLAAIISYLPMVLHELLRGGENLKNLYKLLFKIKDCGPAPMTFLDSAHRTVDRFSSSFWTTISGRMYEAPWKMWENATLENKFIFFAGIIFALFWVVSLIIQLIDKKQIVKRDNLMIVVIVLSGVYILMTLFYSNALYDYYFMTIIPLVYIVFAYIFAKVWPNILGKIIVVILVSTFVGVNVNSFVTYIQARLNRDKTINYINPDLLWIDKVELVKFIKNDSGGGPISVRYYIDVPIANRVYQYLFDQQGVDIGGSDRYEYVIIEPKNRDIGQELAGMSITLDKTFNTLRLVKISK